MLYPEIVRIDCHKPLISAGHYVEYGRDYGTSAIINNGTVVSTGNRDNMNKNHRIELSHSVYKKTGVM